MGDASQWHSLAQRMEMSHVSGHESLLNASNASIQTPRSAFVNAEGTLSPRGESIAPPMRRRCAALRRVARPPAPPMDSGRLLSGTRRPRQPCITHSQPLRGAQTAPQ